MAKKLAAWLLAAVIMAAPSVGLTQEQKSVKPIIPKEIKKLLPNISEEEKKKQMDGDQILPEPIMDEESVPITKEIPS